MTVEEIPQTEKKPAEYLTEVSRRRLLINATANYGKYAVAFLVNFFLAAYVIRKLGKVEYSLWPLVATVTSVIALIPSGIGAGTGRFIAHAMGRQDKEEVSRITTSVFVALLVASVVYAGFVVVFSLAFERIFTIPPQTAGLGPKVMFVMGIAGAVRIPFGVFQGGLYAAQQFVALGLREICLQLLRMVLTVVAFSVWGPSLLWVAAVFLSIEILNALVTWQLAVRLVPWQRIDWKSFDRLTLKTVSSFSAWGLVAEVAGLLYWRTDSIVINKLLDPTLLTGYSVVAGTLLQAYSLASLGSGVMVPSATIMHATQQIDRLARMIYRANRLTIAMGAPAIVFLMIFGSPLMVLYLGKPEFASFGPLFVVLGGPMVLSMTQITSGIVPQAFGENRPASIGSLLVAVVNVLLSLYFVVFLKWGLWGVAASTAIVMALYRPAFWPWYVSKLLGVPWREYFAGTVVTPLVHCAPACSVMLLFRASGIDSSPKNLALIVVTTVAVHAIYMLLYGLPREDRRAALDGLSKLIRRSTGTR